MGDEQKTQDQITTSEPWSKQAPYLEDIMKKAQTLYNSNTPSYYPNSTVAGFSPEQQQAQQLGTQRAVNGSPLNQAAGGYLQDVLGGNYLGNMEGRASGVVDNILGGLGGIFGMIPGVGEFLQGQMGADPNSTGQSDAMDYFRNVLGGGFLNSGDQNGALFDSIRNQVMPAINSQFMSSGRYGSGANMGSATQALTDAYAPIAYSSYQAERGRQGDAANALQSQFNTNRATQFAGADAMQNNAQQNVSNQLNAAGMAQNAYQNERGAQQQMAQYAPTLAETDWTDLGHLMNIGNQKQDLAQSELNDAVARFNFNQDLPYNKLAQYMGLVGGSYGGTTTSAVPYTQPGLFSQLAGPLALLGAAAI